MRLYNSTTKPTHETLNDVLLLTPKTYNMLHVQLIILRTKWIQQNICVSVVFT